MYKQFHAHVRDRILLLTDCCGVLCTLGSQKYKVKNIAADGLSNLIEILPKEMIITFWHLFRECHQGPP